MADTEKINGGTENTESTNSKSNYKYLAFGCIALTICPALAIITTVLAVVAELKLPTAIRVALGIATAASGIVAGMLGESVRPNVVYQLTKRGRKPNPRPARLWIAFIVSALIAIISGTLVTVAPGEGLFSVDEAVVTPVIITATPPISVDFDEQEEKIVISYTNLSETANAISWSPDSTILATANAFSIRLWDVSDWTLIRTLSGHPDKVNDIDFSPDGDKLVSGGAEGLVRLWNVSNGELIFSERATDETIRSKPFKSVYSVAFSSNGDLFATGGGELSARIWQTSDGTPLLTLWHPRYQDLTQPVRSVTFSPDGTIFATVANDAVRFWRVSDGELQGSYNGSANDMVFSPDGHVLAVGIEDGPIHLLDVNQVERLQILEGHLHTVGSLDISPDGRYLASAGGFFEPSLRIWDMSDGKLLRLIQFETAICDLEFSPDGTTLATAFFSYDNRIVLWDVSKLTEDADQ